MPYGLKRFQKAESLHFITFSCFHRLPLLDTPGARETVEAVLEVTRARHQARIYAYVLMPEHVHLLINEPPAILLAQFLKAVKQIASRKLRGQREKFWQERYFDRNIHGEDARSEVIRYIHRNPVKRGLVASPGDYPWSSFNHYAIGIRGAVEIESWWTARLRAQAITGNSSGTAHKVEQVGDMLSGPAAGLVQAVRTHDLNKAAAAGNVESLFTAGTGLVDKSVPLLQRAVEFGMSVMGFSD